MIIPIAMKMTKSTLISLALLLFLGFSACDTKVQSAMNSQQGDLADGIYLLVRKGNKSPEILPLADGERIIKFNKEFYEKTDQDQKYLVIDSREFAEMQLKAKPATQDQDDGRKRLLLTLTDAAKEQLKDFTTKHLMQMTTIVVGGEALTTHMIKAVIDSGLMQITRCTDNACELLYVELQDNVVE